MSKERRSPVRPPPHAGRSASAGRPSNHLLAALPDKVFQRLHPHLKTISVRPKQMLYKQGEPIQRVYFPIGGVFSVTTALSTGTMVETATIGNEGMLGVEVFLTDDSIAAGNTFMQVPDGGVQVISAAAFRRAVATPGALRNLIGRYTQAVIAQMMQSTACNAVHQVPQRCARWLLMTHDRMHEQDFTLSHEFLAMMLGVQRPTVSAVAATLQKAGLIRYTHGRVTVRDRQGLEAASCECYPIIRAHFDQLQRRA